MERKLIFNLAAPITQTWHTQIEAALPRLNAALGRYKTVQQNKSADATEGNGTIYICAAQLGVAQDHVTLQKLVLLNAAQRAAAYAVLSDVWDDSLLFSAKVDSKTEAESDKSCVLGTLRLSSNLSANQPETVHEITANLPAPAAWIAQNMRDALPATAAALPLKQAQNMAQMLLHQVNSNLSRNLPFNSIWFCNADPFQSTADAALNAEWLTGGGPAWFAALPAFDENAAALILQHPNAEVELRTALGTTCLTPPSAGNAMQKLWHKTLLNTVQKMIQPYFVKPKKLGQHLENIKI